MRKVIFLFKFRVLKTIFNRSQLFSKINNWLLTWKLTSHSTNPSWGWLSRAEVKPDGVEDNFLEPDQNLSIVLNFVERLANTVFDANKNDRSDALVGHKDPFWARSEGDELEYDGNYDSSVEENKSPFQRNYRVPYENADEDVIPRSADKHENNDGIFEMLLRSASHEGMNDTPFKRARIPVPCSMCCKIRR